MDTYSYISENGTVRQIEDLLAKAKNEEQDIRIAALEQKSNVYPSAPTTPVTVYDVTDSPGELNRSMQVAETGYYCFYMRAYSDGNSHNTNLYVNGVSVASDYSSANGSTASINCCIPLNQGDTVRMTVTANGSNPSDSLQIRVKRL